MSFGIRPGVRRLFRLDTRQPGGQVRDEADAEIRLHIQLRIEQLMRDGLTPEAARAEAERRFGPLPEARALLHGSATRREERLRTRELLDALWRDLRLALRMLRRSPAFTTVAIASLALGIGANAAVFSVVNAVLLRPLPYVAPGKLVTVGTRSTGSDGTQEGALSVADVRAMLDGASSFSALGAYAPAYGGLTLTGTGEAEQIVGTRVTSGVWRALGVTPLAGRWPLAGEDAPGGDRVVVLSHAFWRDRFASSASALGRPLTLDGQRYTIVGVMPPAFNLPRHSRDDVWPVLQLDPPEARAPFWLSVIGRLNDGVDEGRARAELTLLAASVKRTYPDASAEWAYFVTDLKASVVSNARATVLILYVAVALVLLLATANVANLFLARATVRGTELAVRTALGASRRQLARQLVTESVLVAVLGGALGLLLASGGVRLLAVGIPGDIPRMQEVSIDGVVLLFTAGIALVTGVLVGVAPAIQVPHRALASRLREGGRGGAEGAERRSLRALFVVGEFAIAVTVLIGAGLVVNSLFHLQRVSAGASAEGVLAAQLTAVETRYPEMAQAEAFYDEVVQRIDAIPGVADVGIGMAVPPNRLVMTNPFTPEGKVYAPGEVAPLAEELMVSPGYFTTLRIPVVRGRTFVDADRDGAPPVAIVNETFARRYFAGRDAVGRWLQTGDPDPESTRLTIVGIVPDVKYQGLDAQAQPTIYVPYRQNRWWRTMYLVVRTAGDPLMALPAIRAAVREVDPAVPLRGVRSMDQLLHESVAEPRFRAALLAGFGVVALLLAAAGIYAVMSYNVSQRRREMGVHTALGAPRGAIVRMVVRDGMRLAVAGVAIGVALALALTRLLSSVLFGVTPLDPATFVLMAVFLVAVGLAACAIPARRASRTDPMLAMRGE
jgi:predicted permease